MRIDVWLVSLGLVPSRNKAQDLIENGDVEIQTAGVWKTVQQPSQKADHLTPEQVRLRSEDLLQFVSRGGLKLQSALDQLQLDARGLTVFDVGISTGGFADCLLQRGASKIIGIDVGTGQLAAKLQNDSRVQAFEKINARELRKHQDVMAAIFDVQLCVIDVSFISLTLILPELAKALPSHRLLALIKPQFELSAQALGKDGVVASEADLKVAQERVLSSAQEAGYQILKVLPSGVKGSDGNQEFFLYAQHGLR